MSRAEAPFVCDRPTSNYGYGSSSRQISGNLQPLLQISRFDPLQESPRDPTNFFAYHHSVDAVIKMLYELIAIVRLSMPTFRSNSIISHHANCFTGPTGQLVRSQRVRPLRSRRIPTHLENRSQIPSTRRHRLTISLCIV